ncbi:urease accessory protein UreD [Staphylococcus cohnii]|uniref:Urease accessory protein UreD n=2 Tax=Staphylococcus cohnii TaxID=29382 RepID=A0ABT6J0L1_9STAP|nr:urease accessory protein UreD [Staphylococcus cohnii]TGP62432.1 urease accessory protein UreD [bacterium M00.F.Ca.ET.229.01.1.1]TGS39264.1 urease accessory protein UreD [bacterium M00.F.Ca.ET.180.01.1.1]AYX90804.1 urease accessory protein UreD [Staphylococcus cohnii]KKI65378.1 Urease accessory protein UreD [Staphylococcus cohnii subsp. cohnii]MCI2941243.1 urease accessory protein UreD [Staphylococcus cohnii]
MANAQQKWTGILDLTVFNNGSKSVARDIFFEKALKVIRPVYLNGSDIPTFYIVNVGGGYLDGDRYKMDFTAEENANVTLTSQGATKIYKTLNDHVEQYQNFNIKDNAYIEYVGDPIIAFENAKFFQHNTFNLSTNGSLFYTDILTPGYSKEDKAFTYTYMHLLNEIYVENELVTFDNLLLDPTKNKVDGLGYMEDYTHLGSCYFIHPEVNQTFIDDIYDYIKHYHKTYHCRFGITQLPTHGFSIRILSNKTQIIERILNAVQTYVAQHIFDREVNFLRKY